MEVTQLLCPMHLPAHKQTLQVEFLPLIEKDNLE